MSTAPALPAGAVAVIDVEELTVNDVAAVLPNLTAVAPLKLVPVIATDVPPASGPAAGVTDVTAGAATYVNLSFAFALDEPPDAVTITSTCPAVPAGAVAVIDDAL